MTQAAGGGARIAPVHSEGEADPTALKFAETFNQYIPDEKMKITAKDLVDPKYKVKPGQSAESA
jgi:hypothetical protein